MEFIQGPEPDLEKPIVIAAMRDMGFVGSIVVDFINTGLGTKPFRVARSTLPGYVVDRRGHIDMPDEEWVYSYADDLVVFGGRFGQPRAAEELHAACRDVIETAKKHSAKFVYTVGGFQTSRQLDKLPAAFVTATSAKLAKQLEGTGFRTTPYETTITGFNGLILGYAKAHKMRGIGVYGELNEPEVPQYRAAKSVIETLEKLTYRRFGDTARLDARAESVDQQMRGRGDGPGGPGA